MQIEILTKQQAAWYGANEACAIIRCNSFAPIAKLAAIKNGKYCDNPETGYIHGNGNTGTSSILVSIDKLESVKALITQ